MSRPQSFESHAKMVPAYHYVASPLITAAAIYFIYTAVTDYSVGNLMTAFLAVGVMVGTFFARVFPLGVQDRLIRLEEQLRMARLLPDDLRGRVDDLTTDQLIGLRFASDDELAGLVRRVLDGELTTRKSIKAAISHWRADHERI